MRSSARHLLEDAVKTSPLALRRQPSLPPRPTASIPQQSYCRARDLPRLIALWPKEIDDCSEDGRRALLQKLRRALREERRRELAGHWTYDITRHAGLLRAYRHELTSRGVSQAPSSWPTVTGRRRS